MECIEQQRTRRGKGGVCTTTTTGTSRKAQKTDKSHGPGKGSGAKGGAGKATASVETYASSCPTSSDDTYENLSPDHLYNLDDEEEDEEDVIDEEDDERYLTDSNISTTSQWLLTSFLRQHQGGKISRQKTVAIV